jgi:hypothetical protein
MSSHLAFALLFAATTATAQTIYQCPDAQGTVLFQARPCAGGSSIELGAPAARWTPPDRAELDMIDTLERSQPEQRSRSARPTRAQVETKACFNKRKALERVSAKLRRGYRASEGTGLRNRRDEYEEYLRRFCPS